MMSALFDDKSMFVHTGGSWGKSRELEVIKSDNIWYKKASVYSTTFNQIGNTAILQGFGFVQRIPVHG